MAKILFPVALAVVANLAANLAAQTTQGTISGRLVDSITGRPVAATVEYSTGSASGSALCDASGYYNLPLLSPGIYRIRAVAPAYQSQEVQELELPVASRIEIDFQLRPLSDVWEAGQYNSVFLPGAKTIVTFFGPDVDTSRSGSFDAQKGRVGSLEASVSQVIDSAEIENLPLQGRDVYTLLITQPGVTSDAATGRGLGLAVNGQRPSASNFLLDGVENNNYLITGPLVTVAPEAIQEYRISTNNFSAEYGRTSGVLANAITRSGTNSLHGVGYFYLINDFFNANGFQQNRFGIARAPQKQIQPGFVVTGPVLRGKLYFSSSYEYFRNRALDDPVTFTFPAAGFFNFTSAASEARALLQRYPAPQLAGNGITAQLAIAPPVELDRTLAIQRFDYTSGKDRVMLRAMASLFAEPDFIWSPYPDFISPLHQNTVAVAASDAHTIHADLINEARASFSDDDLHWNRAHTEIPTLTSSDGVTLPGSPAAYAYRNANRSWEFLDNLVWMRGRHQFTAGAGLLVRSSDGFLTAARDGQFFFTNVVFFALDHPLAFRAAIDRASLPAVQQPDSNRDFGYRQFFGFAEDTFKVSPRLTVNYGLRYELFGAPSNDGSVKDLLVNLGAGSTLAQQLPGATLATGSQIFGTDKNDWAVRAGASYDLFGNARTLLRGGYGIFYDRPFDNLWENVRNNALILPLLTLNGATTNYLAPIATQLAPLNGRVLSSSFPDLTLVDPNLRNGRVQSYFAGIQHRVAANLTAEVNALGSYGRSLITTDIVNRDFSMPAGRYNPSLPDIAYRSGQGFSDYNALAAVIRYRASRGTIQATYTWSHTIDNQSEPLAGDFFNLNFTSVQTSGGSGGRAAFSEQFNPNVDRGNSDFDQRHNLVVFGYWNLPRGFIASALAAFRSGFPYSLIAPITGASSILNQRPDVAGPLGSTSAVAGGERLFNPAAFAVPPATTLGNLGRNALTGPGFYNLDLTLARVFAIREGLHLTARASAFNVLNHANLGNPGTLYGDPSFGVAQYGRQGFSTGFPAVAPLNETPRQMQLSLKIEF
ncbi:MAG: carboxypeptidase-like regulatory domain-containing protein [Acidobacteriia bacterium]|nr:carboxypeptidase-like regulatory domain-containing protein [Terriglobia bacterium]